MARKKTARKRKAPTAKRDANGKFIKRARPSKSRSPSRARSPRREEEDIVEPEDVIPVRGRSRTRSVSRARPAEAYEDREMYEEEPAPPPKRRQVKRRSYGPAHYKDSERKIKISRATIKSKIHDSGLQVANDALILLQKILQEEDDRIVERAIAHTKAKRKKRVVKTHVHAVRE